VRRAGARDTAHRERLTAGSFARTSAAQPSRDAPRGHPDADAADRQREEPTVPGFHTDDEKALIETFRQAGGKRIIFFRRDGEPILPKPMAKALARLLRSGHIDRDSSGDFGWVCYRLRAATNASDAETAPQ
jgi:hypothetical protein